MLCLLSHLDKFSCGRVINVTTRSPAVEQIAPDSVVLTVHALVVDALEPRMIWTRTQSLLEVYTRHRLGRYFTSAAPDLSGPALSL
jgi:hypothetical protein